VHARRVATIFVLAVAFRVGIAAASSDLVPAIYDVHFESDASVSPGEVTEGCAVATSGLTLLRFGTKVTNLGPDTLQIGDPGCPDCTQNPGATCANPWFMCDPGLYTAHFTSAARFELLDPSGTDVVVGAKRGYCFNDDACTGGATPQYTQCNFQGLTTGCTDDYEPSLACQYLDVTGVPNVLTRAFTLRVTIDTADLLPDPNRANDVTEVAIPGCGDGILQTGEECDTGPANGTGCCDANCHLVSAGTTCRPASGPCDAPESCDGTSPTCPADAPVADGTACNAGVPSCVSATCRSGACVTSLASATCLIDATCVAAGASNPADACALCDPSRATDAWSPDVGTDATAIRCELGRVNDAIGATGCRPGAAHRLGGLLKAVERAVGPADGGTTPRHAGAALRRARRLATVAKRLGRRAGCDVSAVETEVGVLMTELAPRPAIRP